MTEPKIIVSQEDREAAARLAEECNPDEADVLVPYYRNGGDSPLTEAFARHRIASTSTPPVGEDIVEVVADAYRRGYNEACEDHDVKPCTTALGDGVAQMMADASAALKACPDCAEPCSVVQLVEEFRRLPLHGDAGCDKLTDDEWCMVARAAIAALHSAPRTEEVERVVRMCESALEPLPVASPFARDLRQIMIAVAALFPPSETAQTGQEGGE